MNDANLLTAFDLNMIYNSIFHNNNWFIQLESKLLINNLIRQLATRCPPHPSIIKTPTQPETFNTSSNITTFVVIWSNQYMTFIIGKVIKEDDTWIHTQHYLLIN